MKLTNYDEKSMELLAQILGFALVDQTIPSNSSIQFQFARLLTRLMFRKEESTEQKTQHFAQERLKDISVSALTALMLKAASLLPIEDGFLRQQWFGLTKVAGFSLLYSAANWLTGTKSEERDYFDLGAFGQELIEGIIFTTVMANCIGLAKTLMPEDDATALVVGGIGGELLYHYGRNRATALYEQCLPEINSDTLVDPTFAPKPG